MIFLLLKHLYEKENPFEKILLRCPAVCMYQALMQGIVESGQAESLKKKDALVGTDKKIRVCAAFVEELKNNDITAWDYTNHTDEVLIALSISAATNPTAELAMEQLSKLRGCEVHSTVILSAVDEKTFKRLGVNLTCEPRFRA